MAPPGFEPGMADYESARAPLNLEENDDFGEGAPHSTALETAKAPIDPELASVIDAWHTLPPDTRTAILAMLRTAE